MKLLSSHAPHRITFAASVLLLALVNACSVIAPAPASSAVSPTAAGESTAPAASTGWQAYTNTSFGLSF